MLEDLHKTDDQMLLSGDEAQYSDKEEIKSGNESEKDDKDEKTGRKVDPKTSTKRIIRNPQPKLNAQRLKGPKGVQTIEKYFEEFKYYGKGHEKKDLDRIMKRLEHWAHRLFPKYQFDDFLEKVEVVGSKKELTTFLTKYRKDMDFDDGEIADDDNDNDNDDNIARRNSSELLDEFDLLIAEQIEKNKQATNSQTIRQHNDEIFDNLFNSGNQQSNQTVTRNQNVTLLSKFYQLDTSSTTNSANEKNIEESEEVKKRIERNRQLAIERRLARMKNNEENKKRKETESQEIIEHVKSSQIKTVQVHATIHTTDVENIDVPEVLNDQILVNQQEIGQETSNIRITSTDDGENSTVNYNLISIDGENYDINEKINNSKGPTDIKLDE